MDGPRVASSAFVQQRIARLQHADAQKRVHGGTRAQVEDQSLRTDARRQAARVLNIPRTDRMYGVEETVSISGASLSKGISADGSKDKLSHPRPSQRKTRSHGKYSHVSSRISKPGLECTPLPGIQLAEAPVTFINPARAILLPTASQTKRPSAAVKSTYQLYSSLMNTIAS
eukprot:m.15771 g.15771  ORF g.15771 m.15771 type:complete len:172 (+) comp6744_c0_seq1:28-543(+)